MLQGIVGVAGEQPVDCNITYEVKSETYSNKCRMNLNDSVFGFILIVFVLPTLFTVFGLPVGDSGLQRL